MNKEEFYIEMSRLLVTNKVFVKRIKSMNPFYSRFILVDQVIDREPHTFPIPVTPCTRFMIAHYIGITSGSIIKYIDELDNQSVHDYAITTFDVFNSKHSYDIALTTINRFHKIGNYGKSSHVPEFNEVAKAIMDIIIRHPELGTRKSILHMYEVESRKLDDVLERRN